MTKPPFRHYLMLWIGGWLDIIDGLCRIATVIWSPYLAFKLVIWESKRDLKRRMKEVEPK